MHRNGKWKQQNWEIKEISYFTKKFLPLLEVVIAFVEKQFMCKIGDEDSCFEKYCDVAIIYLQLPLFRLLNCRLHHPTLPPQFLVVLLHFIHIRKLPGDGQKSEQNERTVWTGGSVGAHTRI